MKALSIIGLVCSSIGILISIAVTQISCYNSFFGESFLNHPGTGLGLLSLIINFFFLAFSIVATISSFRKKKN